MHAVKIDSGSEDVRVARQAERRQITAIRSAPQANSLLVNIITLAKVLRAGHDVLIFRSAARATMLGHAKAAAVADAAAIIHRQDHVAAAGEILIHRVRVVVVIKILPAEQHLPHRPTMHENERGHLARRSCGLEQLSMNFSSISRFEDNLLWDDEVC